MFLETDKKHYSQQGPVSSELVRWAPITSFPIDHIGSLSPVVRCLRSRVISSSLITQEEGQGAPIPFLRQMQSLSIPYKDIMIYLLLLLYHPAYR